MSTDELLDVMRTDESVEMKRTDELLDVMSTDKPVEVRGLMSYWM